MTSPNSQYEHLQQRYVSEYRYPAPDRARIEKSVSFVGSGHTVLDVGAFDGQISEKIGRANNSVTAFEGSSAALQIAGSRGVNTVRGDIAATWPFGDAAFDVVFAGEIIEHLLDTDFFLQECRRVLVSDGRLILTTPNLASLGRRILLLVGKNPYIDTALRANQAGHVRYFVAASLRQLLMENGFRVLRAAGDHIALLPSGAGIPAVGKLLTPLAKSLIVEAQRT